jgi:hypothetical protein
VVLTAKTLAPNDATMNIAIVHNTSTGVTDVPTSADTTPGAYDEVSIGTGKKFGIPNVVAYASCLQAALFGGSADGGALAVSTTLAANLYPCQGTPDGSTLVDLYYLAEQ